MARLSHTARERIKIDGLFRPSGHRTTIAGYVRSFFPDGMWGGDSCGCPDDRCIGYHHDADEECHCLDTCLADYALGGR